MPPDASLSRSLDDQSSFVVAVVLTSEGARSDLLALASVLHRRGVMVEEATMTRPADHRRTFCASFTATRRQAMTVSRTFEGQVDVLDVELRTTNATSALRKSPSHLLT
jgi:hypothetical protein